jgi:hypothetical protein
MNRSNPQAERRANLIQTLASGDPRLDLRIEGGSSRAPDALAFGPRCGDPRADPIPARSGWLPHDNWHDARGC